MADWFLRICGEKSNWGSLCLQRSLIDLLNLLFLITYCLSSLIVAVFRKQHSSRNRNSNWGFSIAIASACCAVTGIAYMIIGLWALSSGELKPWERIDCVLRGLIWLFLLVSLNYQPAKWLKTFAQFWWILFSVLISAYNLEILVNSHSLRVLDAISWPTSLILLFCAIRLNKSDAYRDPSNDSLSKPLLSAQNAKRTEFSEAGFFSRLTFTWMNPLLKLGYSKPLDLNDIPPLDNEDGAFQACEAFLREWDLHVQENTSTDNLVFVVLAKCYLKEILVTALYTLLRTLSFAASPILLYSFVSYSYQERRDLFLGISLVGYLIVIKIVESLSQRHWFFGSRRLRMKMRSAVMAAIFEKQLKLSSQGRKRHSAGEIVNYIAVDAYRLGEFPFWLHLAWSQPLQLLLAVILLFWTVSLGALPGLAPLTICGIINIPFAKMLQKYQSKFMIAQDERQRATSEVLNNMKIIKLQSWEEKFRMAIEALRDVEIKWLKETQIKKAYGSALFWMAPTIVSAVIFAGTAAMRSASLDASTIFTILSTLRVISEPMRMIPEALSMMIQVKVSLDRIGVFLLEEECKDEDVQRNSLHNSDISVNVHNGMFSWEPSTNIPTLSNINLSIRSGEKVAICGPVGAGKSSLLYAILGEIPRISGSVEIFGSIAYVSQTSWIQSGTIRDNILFGKPMNAELYKKAIESCALDKDIENFVHGDLTEIGQRGLNMSGGQKQRIQLARAVYNDADTYLLDDPFSAVDAHTAAILFHDCVMTALERKTVILVTHQVEFLAKADRILVMENGQVTQEGTYEDLLKSGTAFEQLVNAHKSSKTTLDSQNHEKQLENQASFKDPLKPVKQNSEGEITVKGLSAIQLTEDEKRETGELGLKPYKDYISVSKCSFLFGLILLTQSLFVLLQCLATYWLAFAVQMHHFASGIVVGVYAIMSTSSCIFAYIRSLLAAHLGLKASKAFFSGFMDSVFKAPMLFFDSTPTGRIVTRASSDMSILDFDIPYTLAFVISGAIEITGTIIIMVSVTWQVLFVAIPAIILILYIQRYYIASARELVRINGTTKAPIMNYTAESMLGVVTIRAFAMTKRFIQNNLQLIDTDAALFFHTIAALEWVLLRVEALQILIIITASVFLVFLTEGTTAPGFLGLCLSYALTLSSAQVFLTRFYSNLENYVISVERIKQYMHIPPEPPAVIVERRPPPSWPFEGRIDLENLKVKYRPTAPFVLKGITCTFVAGNKIGVVGRTGSGKTTLISALFRLVDPTVGRILIDNLDICTIGLKDLRMKLSIIPQEPTLFRGSVRGNLDPLGLHTDHEIWEALEKCQLKSTISSLPALLDSAVSDDGENWSAGQRQLFCLGRVLLKRNKILVLDEATASIDSATDATLQRVIKREFSSCTVITIAHRVPTVTDSDLVMVLSYGKLVEYDKPLKLLESKNSAFAKLVAEYWSNYEQNSMTHIKNR
ncbi:ABC transporter C family member 8 [Ananas comosus]|uniref:ABC transporter C family member 8 n=1 Tax=Ananas comosus TaxID=4615 RepID=A0A199W593_ANACO|nr:ABC transporter C family member 8 [Ananas comosus]